jgi:hypothetical protein
VFVTAATSKHGLVMIVWDDDDLDGLAAIDVADLRSADVTLPMTHEERDSAETLSDDTVARYMHRAMDRMELDLPPIKKIRPTAPNPQGPAPDGGVLPPIKIIKPGMFWEIES